MSGKHTGDIRARNLIFLCVLMSLMWFKYLMSLMWFKYLMSRMWFKKGLVK
jgi:hypothetical protein